MSSRLCRYGFVGDRRQPYACPRCQELQQLEAANSITPIWWIGDAVSKQEYCHEVHVYVAGAIPNPEAFACKTVLGRRK